MIPLGESTAILPQVQGVGVRNRDFSLTVIQSAPRHLSAVCVSSPIHRATSSVLRKIQSSEKRRNSVSSLSTESKFYKEQEFWQRQSRELLQVESSGGLLPVASKQIHQELLIKMSPGTETISLLETKTDVQLPEFISSNSSHEDEQESKNPSKTKNKTSLSRTSKSTNKSRKSRKSCKRRKSSKFSRKKPSVFERLTNNNSFKSDNLHDREKSEHSSSTRNGVTIFHNNESCGTLLQIKQLQATYSPKRSPKPNTFLLLPKVPRFKKFENNSTRTTIIKKEPEILKSDSNDSQVTSPRRQKSLNMSARREGDLVSCKKIYLSEMQSKAIGGVPSAPPGTPSSDQLKNIEYVPSLKDIKSQRAIKSKLEKIVHKLRIEEQHRKENSIKQDQKKLKESLIQLKQRQRLEIYALNRVMTELENENFKKFMEKKEAVSLGV